MDNSPASATPAGSSLRHKKSRNRPIPPLILWLALLVVISLTGCKDALHEKESQPLRTDSLSNRYVSLADSINYGVVVKNQDDSDSWQEKWLQSFEREAFVDFIFEAVYQGKLQPYDYFTGDPLSRENIKELESSEEFNRSRIGKIQFKERWYFDTNHLHMIKEVSAVMLAYEVYRDDGSFRGYKPAFMVKLPTGLKK